MKLAKVTINHVLYVIYKICKAYIIWYQEDQKDGMLSPS